MTRVAYSVATANNSSQSHGKCNNTQMTHVAYSLHANSQNNNLCQALYPTKTFTAIVLIENIFSSLLSLVNVNRTNWTVRVHLE